VKCPPGLVTIDNTDTNVSPGGLTVDATSLYWSSGNTNSILKMPKCGGPITTLASAQLVPSGIAVDDAYAYWGAEGTLEGVMKVPLTGGTPTRLSFSRGLTFALDATNVYFAGPASLAMVPKAGGETTVFEMNEPTNDVTADSTHVYWTNQGQWTGTKDVGGGVVRMPLGGGTISTVATNQDAPHGVVVGGVNVFWFNNSNPRSVVMAPIGGGTPTTLQSGPAGAIASDSSYVYWTTLPSGESQVTLVRMPLAGGEPTQIASLGQGSVDTLVADGTSVYWANGASGALGRFTPE